eukprot:Tamp_06987.p1 GENE.Tamp_06987~~Tamp_06987.p1  ORF type:complete len:602 (-),score=121.70 Tamp_06987:28-1833(-)
MTRRGPCCLPALIFLALSVNVDGFQVPVRAAALGRRHAVQISAGVLATTRKWSKTAALMAGPPARGRAGVKTVMQLSDVETSPMALPEGLYKMNADMRVAVQMEDFKKAAELRDSIKAETAREPVARLLAELKEAVDEQDYAAAKTLKQQLAGAVKDRALEMRSARGRSPYKVNRLLILNGDGSLLTTDPGGSCPVVLSNPDEAGKIGFMQPCWSPGGDLVVATKVELANKQLAKSKESTVQVFWALDGSELIDVAAPFVPFFYFWMPDSKELVYLTTYGDAKPEAGWQVSMDMVRVMTEEASGLLAAGSMMHVEEGVPLFFCPSPRDRRLLLHVGDKQQVKIIEPLSLEGGEVVLSNKPGNFRCPVWLPKKGDSGEELVVFVERGQGGPGQQLILADARGGTGPQRRRTLMDCDGFTSLAVSPDGEKIAVLTRQKKALTETLSVIDGPFSLEEDPWPTDIAATNDDPNVLKPRRRVFAFYWCPNGRYLLSLTGPEKDDIVAATGGPAQIYWEMLDTLTGRSCEFEPHMPSEMFQSSYLPFFDQYALSQNVWSPDGKSFCYAAQGSEGFGAYVQDIPASGGQVPKPKLVFQGAQSVSWSPL